MRLLRQDNIVMKADTDTGSWEGPVGRLLCSPDLMAVTLQVGSCDVEAETTTSGFVANERFEDLVKGCGMNSRSGIADRDDVVAQVEQDSPFFALAKPVDSVVDQVDEHRQDDGFCFDDSKAEERIAGSQFDTDGSELMVEEALTIGENTIAVDFVLGAVAATVDRTH